MPPSKPPAESFRTHLRRVSSLSREGSMFDELLPPRIDNAYRGHKLALWLFALVVAFRMSQSLVVIFGGYSIVTSADGIPLETFTPAGAQTVVALWTLLGLTRMFIFLMCVLTLLRYRSAI